MAIVDALFRFLKDHKGSDLHLVAGLEPRIRRRGALEAVPGWRPLTEPQLHEMMEEICDPVQWRDYLDTLDLDFAYGLEGVARFRVNYFAQENGPAAVARIIPEQIIPLAELKLPPVIESLAHQRSGLILVTGPTGSGKSTTLAAIIDKINATYARHIVTVEDPIEFVHPSKMCQFSQREVGRHTGSFAAALRAAIREDADVILVGEMRDMDTISLALTAAEMGTLVFGTLHTNSAAKTIDRLIDAFPADEQAQARLSLSESLTAIVSQLLLPTADGKGRCAVNEVLLKTPGLPNIIREGNMAMLLSTLQTGKAMGMQTMDDALEAVVQEGRVRGDDAYRKATDKGRFQKYLPKDEEAAPDA